MTDSEKHLTTDQVAERLGLTVATVQTYVSRGEFPHAWKAGKGYRIPASDVDNYIERQRVAAES